MNTGAMTHHVSSSSPLGYQSDGSVSASSAEDRSPSATSTAVTVGKQRAQVYGLTNTHTPHTRYGTLGPESLPLPFTPASSSAAETTEENAGDENAADNNSTCTDVEDDERPLAASSTPTVPLIRDLGPSRSSSIISSHGGSFCDSLAVSQGEVAVFDEEGMPATHSHHTTDHRSGSNGKHCGAAMDATELGKASAADGCGGGASVEGGETTSPVSTGLTSTDAGMPPLPSLSDANLATSHNRPASLSKLSPRAPLVAARQRQSLSSPAGDVQTLQDLIAWRSHLSDSQSSGDARHGRNGEESTSSGGVAMSCGSPFSKSVPQLAMMAIDASMLSHFPASTPVTPGLWQPISPAASSLAPATPRVVDPVHSSCSSSCSHRLASLQAPAPPSLTSLAPAQQSLSVPSATAAPRSRQGSQESLDQHLNPHYPVSHQCHHQPPSQPRRGSCSTSCPLSPALTTHRIASNQFSKSELSDSLTTTSSAPTSHPTSPASMLPPLPHPHNQATSVDTSSRDTKPHSDSVHGSPNPTTNVTVSALATPVTCTPVTTRATTVLDTRHAARESGIEAGTHQAQPNPPHHTHHSHECHRETPGGGSGAGSRPTASPASSSSLSGAWGIEDYAPAHTRSTAGCLHPCASTSTFRHAGASRCSEASPISPRGALLGLPVIGATPDVVYGSPVGVGYPGPCGSAGPLLRTHSSALSTPCQPAERGATTHDAARQWRGLKAPVEYLDFATPVDDDTNKVVVAFVTALLLLFCLGFIFAL